MNDEETTAPCRVLLVDGDAASEAAVRDTFADYKIDNELQVVRDGSTALALLRRQGRFAAMARPDLVLINMVLPGLDGHHLLWGIRHDPDLADIVVVALTGSAADQRGLREQHLPVDACLRQPVSLDGLAQILRDGDRLGIVVHRKR